MISDWSGTSPSNTPNSSWKRWSSERAVRVVRLESRVATIRKGLAGILNPEYKIGFNRYLFRRQPTRTLVGIPAGTLVPEREMDEFLEDTCRDKL